MGWKMCELKLIGCTSKGDMVIVIAMRQYRRYIACIKCTEKIKNESNVEVKTEEDIRNVEKEMWI